MVFNAYLAYRTKENVIDGEVITFIDVTDRSGRRADAYGQKLRRKNRGDRARASAVLDPDLNVISANANSAASSGQCG